MSTTRITPEMLEHLSRSLHSEFRSLRKALTGEDLDPYTMAHLNKLGYTIEETRRLLLELSKNK